MSAKRVTYSEKQNRRMGAPVKYKELDKELYKWYQECKILGKTITSNLLHQKSYKITVLMEHK